MQKILGLFLMMLLISGAFSSSFAFAQIGPIAEDDFYSVNEDSLLTVAPIGVLLNDTNIDSDIFAIIQTSVGFGTLTLNLDGSFTYSPNPNFNSIDSFTYVATNGTHNSNISTVTLSVNSINDAPIAQNDTASTLEDTPVTILVLNNDSDVDGDLLTVNSITQGTNGTVTTNGTAVTYTPKLHFNGTDSFTYTISDGVLTDDAIVSVIVSSVNNVPIAQNDTASTLEDTPVTILVLNNDSDVDGDLLTVNSITQGTNGTVTTNGTAVTYTPKLHFNGTDSFTYTISDGVLTSNSATIKVTVVSVDDDPDTTTDRKIIKEKLKALKKDFKAKEKELKDQLKALKKDFKAKEKELKDQLKALSKDDEHDDEHDYGHYNEHDDEHDKIIDKKTSQNEFKTLKKELKEEFKAQVKDLKKQFKDEKKNLKDSLKESKKQKKSHKDND